MVLVLVCHSLPIKVFMSSRESVHCSEFGKESQRKQIVGVFRYLALKQRQKQAHCFCRMKPSNDPKSDTYYMLCWWQSTCNFTRPESMSEIKRKHFSWYLNNLMVQFDSYPVCVPRILCDQHYSQVLQQTLKKSQKGVIQWFENQSILYVYTSPIARNIFKENFACWQLKNSVLIEWETTI